jgi:hypothetical protein
MIINFCKTRSLGGSCCRFHLDFFFFFLERTLPSAVKLWGGARTEEQKMKAIISRPIIRNSLPESRCKFLPQHQWRLGQASRSMSFRPRGSTAKFFLAEAKKVYQEAAISDVLAPVENQKLKRNEDIESEKRPSATFDDGDNIDETLQEFIKEFGIEDSEEIQKLREIIQTEEFKKYDSELGETLKKLEEE